MIAIIIVCLIIIICVCVFISNNYQFKKDNFTFWEGPLGSGKTATLSSEGKREYNKRKWYNLLVATKFNNFILTILLYIFPIVNIFWVIICIRNKKYTLKIIKRGLDIYSTYPYRYKKWIWSKWQYSIVIDKGLFDWLIKCNEDCIILLDELGYIFPPDTNNKGQAIMTNKKTTFGLTWLRHAISPCVLCASQSIDEVNITFRRKIQHIYRLSNCKRVFFGLSKVNCIEIQRSEDSGSIITTFNDTDKEHVDNWHYFIYPKYNFSSRYGRFLYSLEGEELDKVACSYDYLLEKIGVKVGERWTSLYYEIK